MAILDGTPQFLGGKPGVVLGAFEESKYTEEKIALSKNDRLVLYTDGVTEANNNYDGFYGDDRLKNTLNKYKDQKLNIIISELTEDIYQYCGTREQFDDLTMLIMKFEGD
jgi:serine phosphatase RsbU (regulator of sigma subunit)